VVVGDFPYVVDGAQFIRVLVLLAFCRMKLFLVVLSSRFLDSPRHFAGVLPFQGVQWPYD
jgi:hypothetical protein